MKLFKFLLSLIAVIAVFYALNNKFGDVPPLGHFLSPQTGFWQNEESDLSAETLSIEGLLDEVKVDYDDDLIPHVFAQNDADLYTAQGYITAQHRLWQMEFQTHAAAGRLSEIIGEKALNFDRTQRRKGMVYGAEQALAKMAQDPETMSLIDAYTNGVNNYINSLNPSKYPVEYKLLDYKPELWTPTKTALLLMYMTDMLAARDYDLEFTNTLRKFGKQNFDFLFPDFFDVNDPIIPKERDWSDINPVKVEVPFSELPKDTIANTFEKPDPNNGSNNWAVSAAKSVSGNPILANDPHLSLNIPSIWYVMQLATPEHNTYGATIPGALGIVIGFNNDVAWGVTNATRDVKDWYKITFKDSTRQSYLHDNQWKQVTYRTEIIKQRNADSYIDSVAYTHHGPVSYDSSFNTNNELVGYAMQWTGHIGGNNQRTLLELNKSRNYNDYKEAIKHFIAPAQNFAFVSREGDIALWIQGQFPNKWEGQGKFLMDGTNPEHDWQGFIPQEHNAHILNPERGFISSANQHPVDKSYPYYVFNDGYEAYRNRIINDFLRSKEKFDIEDFKSLQNNNFSLKASEALPTMLNYIDPNKLSAEQKRIFDEISNWNYLNNTNEVGSSIFETWFSKLYELMWDEFDSEAQALKKPFTYQTIYILNNYPDHEFMDILDTPQKETAKELVHQSFIETVNTITDWQNKNGSYNWERYKATYVGHLLQGLPAFSRFNLPIGGNGDNVNATKKNHGPSWKMIVEMSNPPKAFGIYPGGQSGNPGSKYYDNLIDDWAAGNYRKIIFMQFPNEPEQPMNSQTLKPKN